MRILVTGSSGVIGRHFCQLAHSDGHVLVTPSREELDLFDGDSVRSSVEGASAVVHLATRIPKLDQMGQPGIWEQNDRLRTTAVSLLVQAAIDLEVEAYLQPTVTFVYPDTEDPADETTPPARPVASYLDSALVSERHIADFARHGRRGIALRLGLLDGPGTGHSTPNRQFGASIDVRDAACALLIALKLDSGIYNVCRDNERVSNKKFRTVANWAPRY